MNNRLETFKLEKEAQLPHAKFSIYRKVTYIEVLLGNNSNTTV